jgi:5-methylcytosine-specific restriction endonuclease McrA
MAKYASHAEKLRAYRENDRDRHNQKRREWRERNLEKARASAREWAQRRKLDGYQPTPPQTEAERMRSRIKASRRRAAGNVSSDLISRRLEQQNFRCACCKIKLGTKYHIDHIQPIALGGTSDAKNIQVLCVPCNLNKGAKDPLHHMRERGFLL